VRADPEPLRRVLLALAARAGAAFGDAGTLDLTTDIVAVPEGGAVALQPGAYGRIVMHDTAVALSPDDTPHLFEPFHTNGSIIESSGLALSSAYGTVKQLGGEITVESIPGQGNTLTVWLPALAAPTRADTVAPVRPVSERTVLLVEADAGVQGLVERIVRDMGFDILCAPDMLAGERLCDAHHEQIDVAIVDLDISDATEQLMARLATHCRDAHIVVLSSYAAELRRVQHGANPPSAAIPKPFPPQRLIDCLLTLRHDQA